MTFLCNFFRWNSTKADAIIVTKWLNNLQLFTSNRWLIKDTIQSYLAAAERRIDTLKLSELMHQDQYCILFYFLGKEHEPCSSQRNSEAGFVSAEKNWASALQKRLLTYMYLLTIFAGLSVAQGFLQLSFWTKLPIIFMLAWALYFLANLNYRNYQMNLRKLL